MAKGGWYNGFDWTARNAKLTALKRCIASGELAPATGPCELCGDPEVPVEYHDEDYSQPYRWTKPATYSLCVCFHRHKLHRRFSCGTHWQAFLAHVRRAGYACDMRSPAVRREMALYQAAVKRGESPTLCPLRPYRSTSGGEWFASLSTARCTQLQPVRIAQQLPGPYAVVPVTTDLPNSG
jgi:hypothetical protein